MMDDDRETTGKDEQRLLEAPTALYPVFDITGHHAVKEMPILGLAQGLTAGSEDSPRRTTLGNSAILQPSQLHISAQIITMPTRLVLISRAISSQLSLSTEVYQEFQNAPSVSCCINETWINIQICIYQDHQQNIHKFYST